MLPNLWPTYFIEGGIANICELKCLGSFAYGLGEPNRFAMPNSMSCC